jgi:predicted DCC family thiol-disulfide oxidoreductase YuxK
VTGDARPQGPAWVLFDGRCGLCDGAVRWLIRHDRRAALSFAPLEGAVAAAVRRRHPDLPPGDETFVLVEAPEGTGERVRVRSDAALAALSRLGGGWRLASGLRVVPPFLRDAIYRWVARNRTIWFGRLDACRMPTPEERGRFLEVPAEGGRSASIPEG